MILLKQANEARWGATCTRIGIDPEQAALVWSELSTAYTEPSRHYHNLQHVDRMLTWLDRSQQGTDALEVAICFHDCVYAPLAQDNEAQSLAIFVESLSGRLSESFIQYVSRLILATDVRRPRRQQMDERLMIDIDLSVLSAEPAVYAAYASAIRLEYAAVPDVDYRAGRGTVLRKIQSSPIYSTDLFVPREQSARCNIENELLRLGDQ